MEADGQHQPVEDEEEFQKFGPLEPPEVQEAGESPEAAPEVMEDIYEPTEPDLEAAAAADVEAVAAEVSLVDKLEQLDADQRFIYQFVRDTGGDHMKVVSEIYSPPRVTAAAASLPEYGIDPGTAMDLKNGWDFDKLEHRRRARQEQ